MEFKLVYSNALEEPAETIWYMLATQSSGDEYDQATLSPTKDLKDAFCTLKLGQWSDQIRTSIMMKDGTPREVFFRCKLLQLSEDAEEFLFFIGAMTAQESLFSSPPEVAEKLFKLDGCLYRDNASDLTHLGFIDWDTYLETSADVNVWMGNAVDSLMKNHEWDLFIMHEHTQDYAWHTAMTGMASDDPELRDKAYDFTRKSLEMNDRMLGQIVEAAGPDTLVVLVGDHGAVPDGPMFDPNLPLVKAGLTVMEQEDGSAKEMDKFEKFVAKMGLAVTNAPDYTKTKAVPQRSCHIYINLKGRYPHGIVEPEDYEKVQQEIIDALVTYVDPATGKRPVRWP